MSNGPYIVDETCLVFVKNIEEENERLRAENEKLRDAYDTDALTISYNLGYTCGKDIAKDEIEKMHREAAIRIDQIEREQEAHLKTMADLYYQAEMNARLLTENASLRAENETLRRDVKTAVMGDSAELQDVKRENEKMREALKPFAEKYTIKDDSLPNEHNALALINVGDLRAAAAAIRESGDE